MEGSDENEDLLLLFENTWHKFVQWVKDNAHHIQDKEKEKLLVTGIDRDPTFAFAMMLEPSETAPKGKLLAQKDAIAARDVSHLLLLAGKTLDLTGVKFPPQIVDKGFDFADVFVLLIEEIQR